MIPLFDGDVKISTFSCLQISIDPGNEELCREHAIGDLLKSGPLLLEAPCGEKLSYASPEDFPRESIKCPNSGKCGAEECFLVRIVYQPPIIWGPNSEVGDVPNR